MIKQIIIVSVFTLLASVLLMYLFQRHFIYNPARQTPLPEEYHARDMQVLSLKTEDGLKLNTWYKPAQPHQPTLLYLHGNSGHIGNRMVLGRQFIDHGFGLLLLDYRGYGGNKGKPTEQGLYEDGQTALRFLQAEGIKANHIVLYGESLGTGVATKLAQTNKICALILQSPYTSMSDLSRYYYPFLPLKLWDRFDSLSRIQSIHVPLLILHGAKDTVVPYSQGLSLFQQANEPKKMITFEMEGHNNIWNAPGFAENVSRFIDENCKMSALVSR